MPDFYQRKRRRSISHDDEAPASVARWRQTAKPRLRHRDYTVGWICALPLEMAVAEAMLDEFHEDLAGTHADDSNAYTLGSIGPHNVVVACLPKGGIGNNNAAVVASHMLASFPSLRHRFMVGIGGGVPGSVDVRLGDIVVGEQVVQYDLGKAAPGGHFQRTAIPTKPPPVMLTAVSKLTASHSRRPSRILQLCDEMHSRYPTMSAFRHPETPDLLFDSHCSHIRGATTCAGCDRSSLVERLRRSGPHPVIHHGIVASGNAVIKDTTTRDSLAKELHAICFEMEAAGLGDGFPSLTVRGICDYSDSHKNKEWQGYAAAVAAAYAKELLLEIPSSLYAPSLEPWHKPSALHLTQPSPPDLNIMRKALVKSLAFDEVDLRHRSIKGAYGETCEWFLKHPRYLDWLDPHKFAQHRGFLWISGKPGAGKSILMKFIKSKTENTLTWPAASTTVVSFFFHARGTELEKSIEGMYRSLLLQIFTSLPHLQHHLDEHGRGQSTMEGPHSTVWTADMLQEVFRAVVKSLGNRRLICFIDALDECGENQVREMVGFFEELGAMASHSSFSTCFSSRHYPHIQLQSGGVRVTLEDQLGHSRDIESYVQCKLKMGRSTAADQLHALVMKKASGVFMWVVLVVEILNKELQHGRIHEAMRRLEELPPRLSDLFRDILKRDDAHLDEMTLCIQWILYSKRPLELPELYFAVRSGLCVSHPAFPYEWDPEYETLEMMTLFLLSSSRGLAEVAPKSLRVQFIHESVRDFFLDDQSTCALWADHSAGSEVSAHDRLQACCAAYIRPYRSTTWHFSHLTSELAPWQPASKLHSAQGEEIDPRRDLLRKYPFLEYATMNLFRHAEAGSSSVLQVLFDGIEFRRWICLETLLRSTNVLPREMDTPILSYFAELNATRLIKEYCLDNSRVRSSSQPDPILTAIRSGHEDSFHLLLRHVPDVNLADRWGNTMAITAAECGQDSILEHLLSMPGIDVNVQGLCGFTALMGAVCRNYSSIVTRLLKVEGINVGLLNRVGNSALDLAVERSDMRKHSFLVDQIASALGVDMNYTPHWSTPLSHVAEHGTQVTFSPWKSASGCGEVD